MTNGEVKPPKKGGCGKYLAIGCVSAIILAAIGGYVAYRGIKSVVSGLADQYTATAPSQIPGIQVADQEAEAVLQRVATFAKALKENQPAAELDLTSRDINVLIQKHPNWTNLAGKVSVTIEGDKLLGEASIPLNDLGGMFKGRYLNGSAVFRLDLAAGRLLVFIDSLTVNGKPLPAEIMQPLRAKNFAEEAGQDEKTAALLQKLEAVTVRDGMIRIVPKPVR